MNKILEEHGIEEVLNLLSGKNGYPDNFNAEDFLAVNVNGKPYKMYRGWLEGSGRGANSVLSRMILGTEEGLSGGNDLTLRDDLAPQFSGVLLYLAMAGLDDSFRFRSIKLYELASYFGLEDMMECIKYKGWPIKDKREIVSAGSIGVVSKFVKKREGFGFLLDKETRREIWFSAGSVTTAKEGEGGMHFGVGAECRYNIVIPRKGKRPNDPKAINICALGDEPFEKIDDSWW